MWDYDAIMDRLRGRNLTEPIDHLPIHRNDIHWIVVLALGLLIVRNLAGAFQPWATNLLLIWNDHALPGVSRLIDVVRLPGIPILFAALGMGSGLGLERRTWRQLLGNGALRILLPPLFATFAVGPLCLAIAFHYYYGRASYVPAPGHLWFLGNVLIYWTLLLPIVIWVERRPHNWLVRGLERMVGAAGGGGMILLTVPGILEAILVDPAVYSAYALTMHGLLVGFIFFGLGFLIVCASETGRRAAERLRFGALALGCGLCIARQLNLWGTSNALAVLESTAWVMAIWGLASRHLDRPSGVLRYLFPAAFPVYILHLPVQLLVSSFLIPFGMHPLLKLSLLTVLTLGGTFGLYEIVKRLRWVRPLFGMAWISRKGRARTPPEAG